MFWLFIIYKISHLSILFCVKLVLGHSIFVWIVQLVVDMVLNHWILNLVCLRKSSIGVVLTMMTREGGVIVLRMVCQTELA